MGIDLIVSPRSVTLSSILKYFHEEDFTSMAVMREGDLKVVEMKVKERSKAANKRIDGLMGLFKRELIIGAIVREGKVIIPRGETFIRPKDRLMMFTKGGNLKWLKDHF
jgi:trk system potassium uptake protein TrkA